MNIRDPRFIIVLFITLIIASYVELTFGGSGYLAIIFFICSLFLLAKLKGDEKAAGLKGSKKILLLGTIIIIADVLYNVKTVSDIQTLDTMVIFFGLSLIALSLKNSSISSVGEFGVYFSSIFLLFYLILYAMPSRIGSNVYDYYGYYATTIPSVSILEALGFSLHMDSLTTFHAYGIEPIYYKIDLGCFGFYSMLLIISTVLAYRLTSRQRNQHSLIKITVILVIASYFSNLLRIIGLVAIGYFFGLNTMLVFHAFLGWFLFAVIVLPVTYIYLGGTKPPVSTLK